jgi:hypothetical protein
MSYEEIHVVVPGCPDDPRNPRIAPPGVVIHCAPELHPDDVTVVRGMPVTSLPRTLIDCAEDADVIELRSMFAAARDKGLLDRAEFEAALGRVEWRPSLPLVRKLLDEFCP